ncbi:uncharacterized protein LOC135335856 isoform X2 [Halichondria panicea]|uniref:uncharacterized protein LOC135335856 isoform X2 n=1 Tax=Halichondria panicea TaxID=6063 RepID=UPI00312BB2AE
MERLLLSLAIFLISTSAVQAQLACFTDSDCATPVVGGFSSNAEDCCVNNDAGMSYTTSDGGQCFQCIVYGFGSDTFTNPEAQFPYNVPFAYFKGPSNAQLRMAIDYNGEGTASEEEFGIGQSVVSLPLNPGGTTSITFQADRVALEPDETFVLELALLNVANANRALFDSSLPNVFFRSRQEFIIQDSTALVFRLRESDRVVDEGRREIAVEVTVSNEVELASDISLVLTPMIATEDFRPLPTTRPFARANTIEGRIDFFTTPITLNFTAGGEILLAGDVLIYDDLIDEALEYFVVTLTFQDPDNVPPLASIESNGGDIIRIDIIDNDDIFIGFALPNTTYPEVEATPNIQIIKGAGNVTEQTISFVVNLFQTAPEGLGTATPSAGGEDNDFFIPSSTLRSIEPEENNVFVDFDIFADELPEITEAAQLRLSLPTDGMFPGFETLPQYPEFFIIIEDDDRFRIGFERTSYIVNEGIGTQEVCVVMFEPPENTPLGTLTVSIGVETVRGTADGDDYTEVTGARFAYFLFFSDTSRRSCFMVEITEDNRYEFEEQFSLRFIELEGTSLPDNLVLDPARSNITILDDTEVTVGFINPPYSAREDEGPMIFTVGVTSGHILDRDIELSFSTVDGLIADFAAMAGVDYTSIMNMPIILSAGMQTIQIAVELINDTIFENNEMFQGTLTIISGERVSLSPGTANATIIEDEVVCQELELLVNGRIEYSPDTMAPYLEGTNAEHICFPGFVLIGNVIRVCQSDSTFSGVPPTCQPILCNPLDGIENGVITYAPDTTPNYDLSTVATYACDAGYFLDLSLGGSETRTCVDDEDNDAEGVFSGQAPICIPIECLPLDPIINGVITYAIDTTPNYDLGTVAFHVCNPGFFLDLSQGGSTFRTCVDDDGLDAIGEFDNQAPTCIPIECPPLDPITNGVITYAPDTTSNYDLDTVATYECDAGFFLDLSLGGSEMRTCVDDDGLDAIGEFDNQAPRCIPIECLPLDPITNGAITYAPDIAFNYDLDTVATYECDAGFFLDLSLGGSMTRTCVDDEDNDAEGVFSGQAPRCILIQCSPLTAITNGVITYAPDITPNYDLGTVATYDCDTGFALDLSLGGSMTRTCFDDLDNDAEGVFSGQAPRCIPIECRVLPVFTNGMIVYATDVTPNFELGTTATYSCNEGYTLDTSIGVEVRTCIDDGDNDAVGVFSDQEPACVRIQCTPLPGIPNGRIEYGPDMTPNYMLGTTATYICNDGFFLDLSVGNEVRTCEDDNGLDDLGEFTGSQPTCVPIECLLLPTFTNGMISYSPDISPNFDLGTDATYTCDAGFFLDVTAASQVRTCIDDNGMDAIGVWSGQEPSCIPVECSPLTTIANGFITYAPDTTFNYDLGTVATYDCNAGFVLDLSLGGSVTRTCFDDLDNDAEGVFSGQAPACILVCQELELLVNGRIEYLPDTTAPYLEGTIAEHICFPGFVLIGNVMRICQNDSTFSGVPPTCQPIECPPLDGIENGVITYADDITPNYTLSTVATYDCDTGYFLDFSLGGSEMRTCVDDDGLDAIGEFDNQAPICIPIECPPLDPITNGVITYAPDTTPNYDLGTVATYDCNAGFVLDLSQGGSMTRTCFDDLDNDAEGLFSGQAPACIPIECPPLDPITNGVITYAPDTTPNYDLGTVATYTCNDSFRLDISQGGSETRTCIDDLNGDAVGVFTNLPPRCVLINVVRVNDTVIGDPLMTVPLYVQNKSAIMPLGEDDLIHLCFEVHGSSDAYFNLVSDDCVSVNAHYQQIAAGEDINIVDDISVRAVASDGSCHNIEVLLDQCTARVDGVVINDMYSMNDIMVRKYPSRVRIAVPNCGSARGLVMWVMCQTQTFWSTDRTNADGTEFTFQGEAIRFVVARGLNLREESHGILGQFWNIPIQVVPYNGPFTEHQVEDDVATFSVIINSPGDSPRQFIAWLRFPSWEYERRMYCLYAGDGHAGSVYEVPAGPANGPVIEGIYTDYIVSGQFETDFEYNQFDSNMCL